MILGIGVDIVSNSRFDNKPEGFLEKLFTPEELASSHDSCNVFYGDGHYSAENFC